MFFYHTGFLKKPPGSKKHWKKHIAQKSGFTLIELLIVIGIISILAGAAVFGYRKYVRHAYTSEVYGMIAAIKSSEENYKAETGRFLSTGSNETDFYPSLYSAGTEPAKKKFDAATKAEWQALGVSSPSKHLYCGYVAIGGEANDFTGGGARGISLFGGEVPKVPWYYIRATCDLDGKSGQNSYYETTFDRQTVYVENEGN